MTILDSTGRGFARKSKASLFVVENLEKLHIYYEIFQKLFDQLFHSVTSFNRFLLT